jgi:hypothetical protein
MRVAECGARVARILALVSLFPALALAGGVPDHEQLPPATVRASAFGVRGELAAPPAGVADLKFREFFRLPIGPRGLEPGERLKALDGKRVRLVGYMADREEPAKGFLILMPLPVAIAEVEDGPADDMPASVAYVHLDGFSDRALPYMPGLLQFTGTLSVGGREESDGRVSTVRLQLDHRSTAALLHLGAKAVAAKH